MTRILSLILLLSLPILSLAEFRASVDRNQLSINESLTLTLSTDTQVDTQSIDLAPLRQEFEILAANPQSSISIINGRQSAQTRWVVTLLPKSTGTLVVPSFSLNGETTSPISVEVSQVSQRIGDSPITAQIEIRDDTIYVNEQLVVTVNLISSPEVSSLSGEQLKIDNAEVTLLDTQRFSRVVNGQNWQVNQWRYSVFSRNPGQLLIPAQTFSGIIGPTSRSLLDPIGSGRRILARSEPVDIQVVPAPANTANWLPAQNLDIEVIWSGDPNSLEVGEPMTRTIVAAAVGQQAAALPPLETAPSEEYKVYADQPQMSQQPTREALTSERRDSAAIVPSQAGEIHFPEIRIPWWDIESESWQEAVLPAETIQVAPASSVPPSGDAGFSPAAAPETPAIPDFEPVELSATGSSSNPLTKWLLGLLLALTVILGLDNLRLRRTPVVKEDIPPVNKPTDKQLWQKVLQTMKTGSPMQIRAALLSWADQHWSKSSPHNLHGLRDLQGADIHDQLRNLEAACAGTAVENFDREAFGSALATWHQSLETVGVKRSEGLPELYPR